MRFCANISLLFTEVPFLERFAAARSAGFDAVELWWPRGENLDAVEAAVADAGVEVVLLNFDAGDMPAGDRGLFSDPARAAELEANLPVALELARAIGCTRLNALLGFGSLDLARENVRRAADLAAPQGASILIEAVNSFENGPYLLQNTRDSAAFVRSTGRDNVRVQYDAYHMQRMEGNLLPTIAEHLDLIGHIQIADAPGRGEPGTGEIDYAYLLPKLDELGYDGWVGLEYKPTRPTVETLGWMERVAS
jgi:hydroxypyruvate isomerase